MTRRALITGASGFAGRHLAEQLVGEGWDVAGTVWQRTTGLAGIREHRIEIEDAPALRRLIDRFRPDVVFHLAAIVDTVRTPDVLKLHGKNILGTAAVLEAIREHVDRTRIVFTSSAFVYGASSPESRPIREEDPLRPVTAYGASKVAAEALVEQFARETEAAVLTARAFQHTGPGHVGPYAMADWGRQVAEIAEGRREPLIRCGNVDVERDYLDVRDVARAYRLLADGGEPSQVYNVASGQPRTMRSLLEELISGSGVEARIEVDPQRLRRVDQPIFVGDSSRLRSHTGWAPGIPIERTLTDLLDFWRRRIATEETPVTP